MKTKSRMTATRRPSFSMDQFRLSAPLWVSRNVRSITARVLMTVLGTVFTACLSFAGTINYGYDAAGRLILVDYGSGQTVEYTYDAAGNRAGAVSCSAAITDMGSYTTLQSAYSAVPSGTTIRVRSAVLAENLDLNAAKTVTLKGGHNCGFSAVTGVSGLSAITVRRGIVTLDNFVLR